MRKEKRGNKKIILIVLLLAVIGLSIGFAAYASTLKIESSALVKADPTDFKVVFSSSATSSVAGTPVLGGKATDADEFAKDATTITGLAATFDEPGQTATWTFNAFNAGKYEAFLNKVTLGEITCTAKEGTSQAKVDEAAKGLSISISVGGTTFTTSNEAVATHSIDVEEGEEIVVTLTYSSTSALADGDFDVAIDPITLEYNSVD